MSSPSCLPAQCGPSLTLWAPTDMDWALIPKLRALSPGPPACLFSESQRPLAPCPCAAAGSGTASTSPPCCRWRKEVVLVGPLVCLHPHHRRQTGTCFSMELVLVLDSVSIAQIGLILAILLSWLWCWNDMQTLEKLEMLCVNPILIGLLCPWDCSAQYSYKPLWAMRLGRRGEGSHEF